jgi:uncharacterized membrane protein YfcA
MMLAFIVFFAFTIQATAGFGSVMISLALGSLLWPLSEIVPIVVPLSFSLSVYILWRYWRDVDLKVLLKLIVPLMGTGVALGMVLVPYASATSLRLLLGLVVSAAALRGLWGLLTGRSLAAKKGSAGSWLWIFGAGIVHGMIATGGPPLVYAIESLGLDKRKFRSTLAAVWFVLNLALTLRFVSTGAFAKAELHSFATLLPVVALAIFVGEHLHSRVSERHFRAAVFSLLILAGGLLWLPMLTA